MNTPTQVIIFGITGDLSQQKILPSLFSLYTEGQLPEKVSFTGFSRRDFTKKDIEDFVRNVLPEHEKREAFVSLFSYIQGDFSSLSSYVQLRQYVERVDLSFTQCSNKLYYLSVSPLYYEMILASLKESGLSLPCGGDLGWARILVEKPFGYDIYSSKKLNALVDTLFQKEQVYRVDHYMAKTSLQEIIVARRDEMLGSRWDREHIREIKINLEETGTVEKRGQFYDSLGVVYDVVQNHVLQMVALALRPLQEGERGEDIQHAREEVFESLTVETESASRGQYESYQSHAGVAPGSETETLVGITLYSSLPDFAGVPIRVRSGKALARAFVGVTVVWKDGTESVFETPSSESKEAYKKVLVDCMNGDQSVFTSGREVELGWKIAEEIKQVIKQKPLEVYVVGKI